MAGIFNLDYPAALMEIYGEINGYKAYCNNCKYSTIRAYLNGKYENGDRSTTHDYEERGFLQTAFSSTAQEKIATTIVDNRADSTTDETGDIPKADGTTLSSDAEYYPDFTGSPTEDKIFLLSIKDVTTTAYGFSYYKDKDSARARNGTDYARANHFNDRTPAVHGS